MPRPCEYHFITHWRMKGTCEEVYDLLSRPLNLPRWWKAPQFQAREIKPANTHGLEQVVEFQMRAWLPYTIRWQLKSVEAARPFHLAAMASGDFVGRGIWMLKQSGPWVEITFDWKVMIEKFFLKKFSFLLKPFFAANHHWMMACGREGLQNELKRRHP